MGIQKLSVIGLANTFAVIDLILHPLFHIWVSLSPKSYEWLMNLFVAGLNLKVTTFDSNIGHIILGTIIEASIFWLLGATVAFLYNKLAQDQH